MGGLVCAVHRRKNKGFPTLKRTLNLGIEKGRLLKNSRPKGGLIQVICYPASPETVDITGFFEKFCIAIRTTSEQSPLCSGAFYFTGNRKHRPPAPLLLLSKPKPLRWASIWYLVRASGQHIVRSDFFCKAHLSLILPRLCPDPKGRTSALLFGRAIFMSIAKRRSALRPANKRSLKLKPAGAVRRLPVFCCCAYRGIGQPRSSSLTLQEKTIRTGASLRETGSDLFLFRAALNFCLRCFCYGRP